MNDGARNVPEADMELYPRPRIPILPLLSWKSLAGFRDSRVPSVLDIGRAVEASSAATAISLVLAHAGIGKGDKILMPAFHCRSMIEPVLAASAALVYYRIKDDTSVDMDDLQEKIDGSIRAMLVVHYFGFPQDMKRLRSFCDEHGLLLIEDCAHCFFGEHHGHPVGWHGDYAVASVRKFFPVCDGGYVISFRRSLAGISLVSPGFAYNMKALLNMLEKAFEYRRMKWTHLLLAAPLALKTKLWEAFKSKHGPESAASLGPSASGGYRYLDRTWINKRMSLISRLVVAISSPSSIARRRRENYRRLVEGVAGLPNGRALLPEIPSGVVPYMFPFLVDDPEKVFPLLKRQGVPIWRWEDTDTSECEVSRLYASRLLQLPCHQELKKDELEWMIKCLNDTLRAARVAVQ